MRVFIARLLEVRIHVSAVNIMVFPILDKSNKREVKVNPSCEANVDKKRNEVSTEQLLGSNQYLDLSHLALIPSQINPNCKELEASQAT